MWFEPKIAMNINPAALGDLTHQVAIVTGSLSSGPKFRP
jgi:hypothetical protein